MRPFSPMSFASWGVVATVLGLTGCASKAAAGPDGGIPSFSPDGGAGSDATVGAVGDGSIRFVDGSAGSDGASSCDNPLDREGCSCPSGSPPRNCYTGAASQAGIGACTFGQQVCTGGAEVGGTWGACTGSGAPTSCAATSSQCGTISDGCGGVLDCGTCPSGQSCSSRGPGGPPGNVCGSAPCVPTTCAALGDNCGLAPDNCGNTLNCGACPTGQACGGAGVPNQCGCTPTTCTALGDTCGSVSDGCGGTLHCGSCPNGQHCGAAGVPNQCGALTGCTSQAARIYVIDDAGVLRTFDPSSLTFAIIGTVDCGSGPVQADSMAIDRSATAWVLDQSGYLYTVNTTTAACTTTSYVPVPGYDMDTGMAFSADSPGGATDSLYIAGSQGELAKLDTVALTLAPIAPFGGAVAAGTPGELTGTGLGQLFGFFATEPAGVGTINKSTAAVANVQVTAVSTGTDFAFSLWSGTYYLYTADTSVDPNDTTDVTLFDPSNGTSQVVLAQVGFRIVGAGESTCVASQ
jgi:hypothetical protein